MGDTLTLCYHALSHRWPAPLAVTPAAFEQQLEQVLERNYEGGTFSRTVGSGGPGRALVVTFDDAFRSVLELAFPIMERLGIPGTVFVPTAYPDSGRPMVWDGLDVWAGGPYAAELECLSWDELRGLQAAGWEIASHTHSHPFLTRLSDASLKRELDESRARCEAELGRGCESLAYPYGDCDERVLRFAGEAGYLHAGALDPRLRNGHDLRHPRIGVYRRDDLRRFNLKTSRAVRTVRSSVAWDALTALRHSGANRKRAAGAAAGVHAEASLAVAMDLANLV